MTFEEWWKLMGEPDVSGTGYTLVREAFAAGRATRPEEGEIKALAREVAMWHIGDGDECGTTARRLIALLDTNNSEPQPQNGEASKT